MEKLHSNIGIGEALLDIINNENGETIRSLMAKQALASNAPIAYFQALLQNGHVCEIAQGLVKTCNEEVSYNAFFNDIQAVREHVAEQTFPLDMQEHIDSWLVWIGIEETAYRMVHELGLKLNATKSADKATKTVH